MKHSPVAKSARLSAQKNSSASTNCSILFAGAGAIAMLLPDQLFATPQGMITQSSVLATLSLLLGLWIFWNHGGSGQITAPGLFGITFAITVGFGGLYWELQNDGGVEPARLGIAAGFWSVLSMYTLFWRRVREYNRINMDGSHTALWLLQCGVVAVIGVLAIRYLGSSLGGTGSRAGIIVQASLASAVILLLGLLNLRGSDGHWLLRFLSIGAVVLVFAQTAFTGYGRLLLVALGMLGLVAVGSAAGRWTKIAVITSVPPGLSILVDLREDVVLVSGATLSGIGSIVNPLQTFDTLVAASNAGAFEHGHGDSFAASLLFWLPRSVWPARPSGFGTELTGMLSPELLSVGHSSSSLIFGEWFYNFGWLGLPLMCIIIGPAVRLLDASHARILARPASGPWGAGLVIVLLLAVSGIVNLVWADSFTFFTRWLQQAGFCVFILMLTSPLFVRSGPDEY